MNIAVHSGHLSGEELLATDVADSLSSVTHLRHYMGPGVQRIPVRYGKVRGSLFLPPGELENLAEKEVKRRSKFLLSSDVLSSRQGLVLVGKDCSSVYSTFLPLCQVLTPLVSSQKEIPPSTSFSSTLKVFSTFHSFYSPQVCRAMSFYLSVYLRIYSMCVQYWHRIHVSVPSCIPICSS